MKKFVIILAVLITTTGTGARESVLSQTQEPKKISQDEIIRVIVGANKAYANIDTLKSYSKSIALSNKSLVEQNNKLRESVDLLIQAAKEAEQREHEAIEKQKEADRIALKLKRESQAKENVINFLTLFAIVGATIILVHNIRNLNRVITNAT